MKSTLLKTGAAVAAAAVAAGVATNPRSSWYTGLRKPPWQPPPAAYPAVWTPLYAAIAYASARAITHAAPADRGAIGRALALNLALNAAWSPLFFRLRSPRTALAELAVLNISNLALARRATTADRTAGALLLPYLAWTAFATALNAAIVRRNPRDRS